MTWTNIMQMEQKDITNKINWIHKDEIRKNKTQRKVLNDY